MPRFRRRTGRRKRFTRKSRFTKRVLRAELSNASTKKVAFAAFDGATLVQGDATGRVAQIYSPLTQIVQGTTEGQFEGNTIWPSHIRLRFSITDAASAASTFAIRFIWFWSRSQADYGINGTQFTSGTRAALVPTQTPPNANPRVFDSLTSAWSPFTGDDWGTYIDNTNVRVLKAKTIHFNTGGAVNGAHFYTLTFRFPRRKITFQNPGEGSLGTAPNYPLIGNYYLMRQVFANGGAANIATTTIGTMDGTYRVYWKDISG